MSRFRCPYCGRARHWTTPTCRDCADLWPNDPDFTDPRPPRAPRAAAAPRATIQAVDTDDDTFYVLERPGHEPVYSAWPHPLEQLCPTAVRIAFQGSRPRHSIVAVVGSDPRQRMSRSHTVRPASL